MRYNLLFVVVCFVLLAPFIMAQKSDEKGQKTTVTIEHADYMEGAERFGKNVQALFGNVKFSHQETLMFCDSAFFHRDSNMVHAYGHVHLIQADSVHLYGDLLRYFANDELAEVRENVKMVNDDVVLTTEFLDYDRKHNIAYYFNGGEIVNGDNNLTSELGYYYPNFDEVHFRDSVVVINPDYTIHSDTLQYNTVSKIVKIVGPTTIYSEENIIYSELGFYDTENDLAQLEKNSSVKGVEQHLFGDTIHYNRNNGFGEVFSNMALHDTTNNVIIKGDYGYYNEITKRALTTKKALMLQIQNEDTLFLHADTLRLDPLETDSTTNQLVRAYYNVKFFREDFQGRCDSMVYNTVDSTNIFYKGPILWAMGNQMSANVIKLYTKNNELDKAEFFDNSFIVSPETDSIHLYNQIKGRNMVGYIKDNDLYKVDVDGNSQAIYYPKDKGVIIGMNKAEASNMTILLEKQQVKGIILRQEPSGNLNPPFLVLEDQRKLVGFRWLDHYRPKKKEDIFIIEEVTETAEQFDYSQFQFDKTMP